MSVFTTQFESKLKAKGIVNIPQLIATFKLLATTEIAEEVHYDKKECLFPSGKIGKVNAQNELLTVVRLMDEEN